MHAHLTFTFTRLQTAHHFLSGRDRPRLGDIQHLNLSFLFSASMGNGVASGKCLHVEELNWWRGIRAGLSQLKHLKEVHIWLDCRSPKGRQALLQDAAELFLFDENTACSVVLSLPANDDNTLDGLGLQRDGLSVVSRGSPRFFGHRYSSTTVSTNGIW